MSDPTELTAAALAAAIRDKRLSAREAVDAHLARIERENARINAIVTLDAEGARARADEADAALARGELRGPLHGVPIALKDSHATAGMRTTAGWDPLADHVPERDGAVARRMRDAGAILVGKTNVPPLLVGPYCENRIFGRTSNPWDTARTPGGSSGGAAAALAAGLVPLDIGSDAVGSVRLPASFCGLFGLKPSERRVSLAGHYCFGDVPGAPRAWRIITTIGPMARSLEDVELAFSLIAGPDGVDPEVPPVPLAVEPTPPLSSLRVAFARTLPGVPVAAEVGGAIEALAAELAGLGARVEERVPAIDWEGAFRDVWAVVGLIGSAGEAQAKEPVPPRIVELVRALDRRDRLILAFEAFHADWDVLLCPAAPAVAFPHGKPRAPITVDGASADYKHFAHHCALFNLTGQPAVVLPYRRSAAGLPIGVQLVGRRWDDGRLLASARAIAEVTGARVAPVSATPGSTAGG